MRWNRRFKLLGLSVLLILLCQLYIYIRRPSQYSHGRKPGSNAQNKGHGHFKEIPDIKPTVSTREELECTVNVTLPREIAPLLRQVHRDEAWWWIVNRVKTLWPHWKQAAIKLNRERNIFNHRLVKQVLVVPGVLLGTDFSKNKSLSSGGPQGDLLQWADLIAALHVLGHNVTLEKDFYQAGRGFRYDRYDWRPSPQCKIRNYDLVYTDIIGLKTFPNDVKKSIKSRLRIVDAYGTEAGYNDARYALIHSLVSNYGGQRLDLKQFYTFYPHTPDNSFLGFVVPPGTGNADSSPIKKDNIGILYGKDPNYFKNATAYIELLMKWMEIHVTVKNDTGLPLGIINHGVVSSSDYHTLLRRAKFFIGMGLPLESTGVMEALHQGCVFLNAAFGPQNAMRSVLQKYGKPTSRLMTSQVPYLQQYVGPPHVFTVDIHNSSQVWTAVNQAYDTQAKPFIPHEFTIEGFLERLNAYIEHQTFGEEDAETWPPLKNMKMTVGKISESCSDACHTAGYVCEPAYFRLLNKKFTFNSLSLPCRDFVQEEDIYLPGYKPDDQKCLLQGYTPLFSCAGGHQLIKRICPCRDAIKYQIALCNGCT